MAVLWLCVNRIPNKNSFFHFCTIMTTFFVKYICNCLHMDYWKYKTAFSYFRLSYEALLSLKIAQYFSLQLIIFLIKKHTYHSKCSTYLHNYVLYWYTRTKPIHNFFAQYIFFMLFYFLAIGQRTRSQNVFLTDKASRRAVRCRLDVPHYIY